MNKRMRKEEDEVYANLQKNFKKYLKKYIMLNKQITSMDKELKL